MSEEQPLPREIRCVLVPVSNLRLLLPNATVAEVITYSKPEPVDNAPEWLLGRIAWRGWRVPLVSFAQLSKSDTGDSEASVRVAVLKALGGNPKLPFVAILTQGFPRLTTLNAELIIPTHDGTPLPPGVRAPGPGARRRGDDSRSGMARSRTAWPARRCRPDRSAGGARHHRMVRHRRLRLSPNSLSGVPVDRLQRR
jgi:chemosensory pili system protein ChpC